MSAKAPGRRGGLGEGGSTGGGKENATRGHYRLIISKLEFQILIA
jgi:hypothetical protein